MDTLEYSKLILKKVSFDKQLLEKELGKAIRHISADDEPALLEWCRKEMGEECGDLALEKFQLLKKESQL